ncbi:MAG: pilus assembly protein [Parasphingorhabdus sp.]|uniref:TadE/TadG family type IV pilus assembly protein n=1 Tax=Parasphingorhabdus sp. TaxID=2709688 RepID=UPI0030023BE2
MIIEKTKSHLTAISGRFQNLSLVKDTSGLALLEFAFSAPILLTVGLTGLETAHLATSHMQVSQIAMLAADNASRARESIDEADIREIFTGLDLTGDSIIFSENARVILSNFEHNGKTGSGAGYWIRWQRCYGGNTKYVSSFGAENDTSENGASAPLNYNANLKDGMGPVGKKITTSGLNAVNFVEVVYDYKPLVSDRFFGDVVIRYQSAFVARERDDHALRNASAIPSSQLWKCNVYGTIDNPPGG